jgi:hypothetical protein
VPLVGGADSLPMERGQSRWRVGWRRLMLVVVCYVCVLCVVVVTIPFSYLTGRNEKIGPAKMADESALITKIASLDAPNVKTAYSNC